MGSTTIWSLNISAWADYSTGEIKTQTAAAPTGSGGGVMFTGYVASCTAKP